MWNLDFSPPRIIEATVFAAMPQTLRLTRQTAWAVANKPGQMVDCFLEGPSFDANGNLYVTDIPHGRIFRIAPDKQWHLVAQTGGWPNGLALHPDGSLWIADYRCGILKCDPDRGDIQEVLGHRNSESFKGVNDLMFDRRGRLYFTDQGQTGLHDPTGRVYRYDTESGRLDMLLANAPSPNGLALNQQENVLFLAVTRANQVWRLPLLADGSVSKAGVFQTFFGVSGPDGLAVDRHDNLLVAHASLGGVFVLNPHAEITHFLRSPAGRTVTNVCLSPRSNTVVFTESSTGTVFKARLPSLDQSQP